jgi:hypothetical protein
MRTVTRLFQAAIMIVLANSFAAGQDPAAIKPETTNKHIKVKYNKSKDLTTVTLKTLSLSSAMNREFTRESESGNLDLEVEFTYPGQTLSKPAEALKFTFRGTQKNQVWQKAQTIALVIDEETALVLGQSTYSSKSQTFYFEEVMSIPVPYEAAKKMAAAKTLRIQLGTRIINIKDDQLQDLRAMVERMSP